MMMMMMNVSPTVSLGMGIPQFWSEVCTSKYSPLLEAIYRKTIR